MQGREQPTNVLKGNKMKLLNKNWFKAILLVLGVLVLGLLLSIGVSEITLNR